MLTLPIKIGIAKTKEATQRHKMALLALLVVHTYFDLSG